MRRAVAAAAALLVLALAASGCGSGVGRAVSGGSADLGHGKQLFTEKCALCHTLREANAGGKIGPQIWHRLHIVPFLNGEFDGQRERIHLVRCAAFEPEPRLSWEQMNAEFVHELRWWTVSDIAGSDAHFVPTGLHMLIATLLRDGPPNQSIDVGT